MSQKLLNTLYILLSCICIYLVIKVSSPQADNIISGDTSTDNNSTNIEKTLPNDFLNFYDKFHNDTIFQLQHILFPLSGRRVNNQGHTESHYWQKAQWLIHHPPSNIGTTYAQQFEVAGDIITETFSSPTYGYSMIRRFELFYGDYYLTYYKEMGP